MIFPATASQPANSGVGLVSGSNLKGGSGGGVGWSGVASGKDGGGGVVEGGRSR